MSILPSSDLPSSDWSRRRRLDRVLRDATRHHGRGETARAEAIYRDVLGQDPDHPGALHGLGLLALQAGRHDLAVGLIGQAARLAPDHAAMHRDLGVALRACGHLDPARAAFHVAALLDPADPAPLAAMADALLRLGRLVEAAEAFRRALALAPQHAGWWHAMGLALRETEPAGAVAALRAAFALAPDDPALRRDLAGLLIETGAPDAARAIAPDDPDVLNNIGVALRDRDRNADALACFDAAIARAPDHASAHLNAASILLMQGDLARGWDEWEWRDRVPDAPARRPGTPRWQGDTLAGRTLLLHAEMGFGDTIQFCRFAPRIAGDVILAVPAPLVRLCATLPGGVRVVPTGAAVAHDVQLPLLGLPRLLGVHRAADLGGAPYLRAEAAATARWRDRLPPGRRRIGLCWAGGAAYADDARRSLSDAQLADLVGRIDGTLVSLRRGGPPPAGLPVADWAGELADFADTAALIAALDVVVSVDTAVAHLAGALGVPVLLLDRFAGDWRWGRGRADTPWYPATTIVRQPAPGDWDSVLAAVAGRLG